MSEQQEPRPVPFYFRYRGMRASRQAPDEYFPNGFWRPPRYRSGNRLEHASDPGLWFFCDGQRIHVVQCTSELVQSLGPRYQTASMYHCQEYLLLINYDAIENAIGDAAIELNRNGEETLHNDLNYMDWSLLRFEYNEQDEASFATFAAQHARLRTQHVNHWFANTLLPSPHQAERNHISHDPARINEGGMNGEISIILGLYAMSAPPARVQTTLQQCFTGGRFQIPPNIGHGRTEKRGLIIDVFSCPGWSNAADLARFGRGEHGRLFP